jgi:O-antigen/teichoic acid export membrane protein
VKVWSVIASTSGTRILATLFSLVTVPLSARVIGPDGRGAIAALTSWVSMLGAILYFSQGQAMMGRLAAEGKRDRFGPHVAALLFTTIILTGVGWLVATVLLLGGVWHTERTIPVLWLVLTFSTLPMLMWEQHMSYLLMAIERLDVSNWALLTGRMVSAGTSIGLLLTGAGPLAILIGNVLGQGVSAAIGLPPILAAARGQLRLRRDVLWPLVKDAIKLHPGAVGTYLVNHFGLVILSTSRPLVEVGHYQLALQLVAMMQTVPQAASWVLYGRLASLGARSTWEFQRRLVISMMGVLIASAVVAFFLAPWVIEILAGLEFRPAVPIFRALLVPFCLTALGTLVGTQWIGRGWLIQLSALNIVVGTLSLLLSWSLVPRLGPMGCVWSTLAAAFVASCTHLVVGGRLELGWRRERRTTRENEAAPVHRGGQ